MVQAASCAAYSKAGALPWQHSLSTTPAATAGIPMGILEDVLKALDRVPNWRRITGLPQEFDAMKARLDALEAKFKPAAGGVCPKCKELTYGLTESLPAPAPWGRMGAMEDHFACSQCGYTDTRRRS